MRLSLRSGERGTSTKVGPWNGGKPLVFLPVSARPLETGHEYRAAQRVRSLFWCIALLVGGMEAWVSRYSMGPDGIAYLDIGDAYWRADWGLAVNAYWSPFYSWLLGLALRLLKPSLYWEFPVVHLVNFLIYVGALWSFDFFWRSALGEGRIVETRTSAWDQAARPSWVWLAVGYTVFLWSSTCLLDLGNVTPDMVVAALVYLASGLLTRIRNGAAGGFLFGALGIVLGLAYLAKAAMFPLAFVFLGVGLFSLRERRKAAHHVALAVAAFAVVAAPFVLALSLAKGRLTFGDAGALNHTWNMTPSLATLHWTGDVPGSGTPTHGVRKLFDAPPVYAFGGPIRSTYSPWYDPSYWYDGVQARFDLAQQLRLIAGNFSSPPRLFFLVVVLLLASWVILRDRTALMEVARSWHLVIPAVAALGMYAMVNIQRRYVAPFIVLCWAAVILAVHRTDSRFSIRLMGYVILAGVVTIVVSLTAWIASQRLARQADSHRAHWAVAEVLREIGIRPGDRVGVIGASFQAYWARLSRVYIVAEVPMDRIATFWAASPSVRAHVLAAFARAGVKVIVAERAPRSILNTGSGWRLIRGTDYAAYLLPGTKSVARDPTPNRGIMTIPRPHPRPESSR